MALSVTCALVALITPQLTLGLTLNKIKKTLESPVLHAKHSLSILNFVCVWWGLRWIFFFLINPIAFKCSILKVNNLFLVCLMGLQRTTSILSLTGGRLPIPNPARISFQISLFSSHSSLNFFMLYKKESLLFISC